MRDNEASPAKTTADTATRVAELIRALYLADARLDEMPKPVDSNERRILTDLRKHIEAAEHLAAQFRPETQHNDGASS